MNERREYFEQLLDWLFAHYNKSQQTRIKKELLLNLLFRRMDIKEKGVRALAKAYLKEHGGKKDGFNSALRSAVSTLIKWINQYYERNPSLPIQFRITEDFRLVSTVKDGFKNKSVPCLYDEADATLDALIEAAEEIKKIRQGKSNPKHADQNARRYRLVREKAIRAEKLAAAIRRRA